MKNTLKCSHPLIDPYYDKELGEADAAAAEDRLKNCRSCRADLTACHSVSALVNNGLDIRLKTDLEPRIIEKIRKKKNGIFRWTGVLVPATAMAVLILYFSWMRVSPPAVLPSAIVSYVSGDISSVMIMETPENRQTILWIRENF